MNGPATGASAYKIWVTTLKAWSRDPSTSLDALPALSAESFSAATSRRFNDHLMTAVGTMMASWVGSFQRDLQAAVVNSDLHAVQLALVGARRRLLPRLRLCQHPGLPPKTRSGLMTLMRDEVTNLQKQVENIASGNDQLTRAVRDNSLMRVFDDGYVDGSAIIRMADAASAPPVSQEPPQSAPSAGASRWSSLFKRRSH